MFNHHEARPSGFPKWLHRRALLPRDTGKAAAPGSDRTWGAAAFLASAVVPGVHAGFDLEFPDDQDAGHLFLSYLPFVSLL